MKKIKKQTIKSFIPLLLISLTLLFCLTTVSAAPGDNIYVNNNTGNDSWDGQSAVYNNTTGSGPKLTISNGINAVNINGTVYIANGTYNEHGITINQNMAIIGESRGGTIINAQGQDRIFTINPETTVTLKNLTLQNGILYYYSHASDLDGGAIYNEGTLNLINCAFTANRAGVGAGGIGTVRGDGGAIFNVGILTITNSTFTGNSAGREDLYEGLDVISYGSGGAIRNNGTLTINNSTFTGNNAYYGSGGAILNWNGTLIITNSTFNSNSAIGGTTGALFNYRGTLTITNCTFTDNQATQVIGSHTGYTSVTYGTASGGAIYNYQGILTLTSSTLTGNKGLPGDGGAILNYANDGYALAFITNCTFTGNAVYFNPFTSTGGSGGAIISYSNNGTAYLSITNSTFTGNSANWGGAVSTGTIDGRTFAYIKDSVFTGNEASHGGTIYNSIQGTGNSTVDMNFNRIVGNIADNSNSDGICNINGIMDANNNWWGDNTPDFSQLLYGMPDPDSWLVMSATPNPTSIRVGDTSTITVTILSYNKTSNTYSPVGHCAPLPAIFTATSGNMNPGSTFIVPNLGIDQVKSIFTSTNEGTATINATVDNETMIFSIQADITPTSIAVPNVTGCYGNNAILTAILKDDLSRPVVGETVHFYVDLMYVGNATTDSTGKAAINYPLNFSVGSHTIQAVFHDDLYKYKPSGGTGTLTVNINPTTISVGDVEGYCGNNAALTAILKDSQGHPVSGETVYFDVNNQIVSTITDSTGTAIINNYLLNLPPGVYVINAAFNGNSNYTGSMGRGTLTIYKIPTTISVNSPTDYNNHTVDIIAALTRTDTGAAVAGKPITITVNGQTYSGNTDSNGQVIWSYPINNMDAKDYTITATFAGDTQCEASNGAGTLTVRKIPTDLSLYIPWSHHYNENTVNITAILKRYDTNTGVPVADKPVTITLNGQTYSGNTDTNGQLTWTYTINNMDAGSYYISATFAGDTQYKNSGDGDLLLVEKIPTSLIISNAGGVGIFKGQTVNISATLIDTVHGNSPVSSKQIDIYVNNVLVPGGPVFTNALGVVTLVYQIAQDAGIYSIHVVFAGDNQYLTSTSNPDGTLTVDKIPTNATVTPLHNFAGQNVTLTANVTDYSGHSINEGSMKFTVNGSYLGTVPVNNGEATLNWTIPGDWTTGNYIILAEYLGTGNFTASNSAGNLTVDATPTSITVGNVTGINTKTVSLNATLTDAYGHPLTGKTINFKINGNNVGNGTTDSNGIAVLNYKLNSAGNFTVTAEFAGDSGYVNSTSNGTLAVDPSSDLYIIITSNKNNQKVDETFTLTYKLGNNGPDAAQNVTITIPLPEDFEVSQITGDGKWTYNNATRTITWTLENVPVGDPYLYITGKVLRPGSYVFGSSISSETYNIDSQGVTEVTINAVSQVHAANKISNKIKAIPLHHTGMPLAGIILAVLAVCSGLITSKKF